jgi:hypothetical protein
MCVVLECLCSNISFLLFDKMLLNCYSNLCFFSPKLRARVWHVRRLYKRHLRLATAINYLIVHCRLYLSPADSPNVVTQTLLISKLPGVDSKFGSLDLCVASAVRQRGRREKDYSRWYMSLNFIYVLSSDRYQAAHCALLLIDILARLSLSP